MNTMTEKQKKGVKKFMKDFLREEGPMSPNQLVLNAVTHCPWANTNHARGTLSVLEQRKVLVRKDGLIYPVYSEGAN